MIWLIISAVSFTLMDDDEPKAASSASDSNQSKPNDDGSYPYETVEVKPLFQGTNVHGFSRWVASRIVYPAAAQKNGIQGKVILSFLIASDGKVTDIKVLSSAHPLLDNEAKRLVALSPAWTPGQQNGKAVPVNYTFPVNFTLTEDDDESAKAEDRNEGL